MKCTLSGLWVLATTVAGAASFVMPPAAPIAIGTLVLGAIMCLAINWTGASGAKSIRANPNQRIAV